MKSAVIVPSGYPTRERLDDGPVAMASEGPRGSSARGAGGSSTRGRRRVAADTSRFIRIFPARPHRPCTYDAMPGGDAMAQYMDGGFLVPSNDPAFGDEHKPGAPAPHSGIYRCTGCGWEVASVAGHHLPPQEHHTHPRSQPKPIVWRLIVLAQHKGRLL